MTTTKPDDAERLRRELQTTSLLLEAGKVLSATIDLGSLLEQLADIALQFTGLPRAFVNTIDADRRVLVPMVATDGVTLPADGPVISFDQLSGTSLGAILAKKTAILDYEAPGVAEHDREIAEANHSRLVLFVPLLVRGEIVGHISLDEPDERHSFSDREIALVEGIASQAAIAVQNARLFEAEIVARQTTAEALQTTALLLEGATVLADAPDLETGLRSLIGKMRVALPGIRTVIYELGKTHSELTVLASAGGPAPPVGARFPLSRMTAAAARVIETKRSEIIDFDALPETERGIAGGFGVHLLNAVPLVYQDTVLGIVVVDEPEQERCVLSRREVEIVEAFAAHASAAIEHARLFESEQRRAEQLAALKAVADAASSSLEVHEIASHIVVGVADALAARQVQIRLLTEDRMSLESVGAFDPDGSIAGPDVMSVDAATATAECFRSRKMKVVEGMADGLVPEMSETPEDAKAARSYVLLPVIVDGQAIGTFCVAWAEPRHFELEDLSFIESVVAQFTWGLQNARLFEAESQAARSAETLAAINEILLSATTLDAVIERLVGEASEAAGADKCMVIEVDCGCYTITQVRNVRSDLVGDTKDASFFPAFALAVETQRPVLVEDCWADDRTNPDFVVPYELRAFQLIPLIVNSEVLGILALAYDEPQKFGPKDVQFAERVSLAMSLAMRNARLYEAERRVADRLQKALLAMPTTIDGVEFSYAYHSASEALRVGGDFYDIFELDEYRVGITIGDVAGKGLDAAVLTSLAKNTIRAHATEHGATPAKILGLTNQVVYRGTSVESFVTILFAVLDRRDDTLTYSNAGHTTGVVVGEDGEIATLPPTGPIIGAFPNLEFEQSELRLTAGDVLFLYTDGLTEARLDDVSFAEQRLLGFLSERCGRSTEIMVTDVVDLVMSLTGGRLRDDLAVLAVRLQVG